ncbi:hypothetical protein IWW50_004396 [Coemansia erecta]|nr:hypothetical protein GGF43_001766 [Coemansia sp. RSA 2618]KAJ2822025.1 hypothetical protein IWW50_004396 [Coemansia erecta]
MCAYRSTATFEERGICPPPKDSVTVGESDLKFIHLRDGEDTGLLQYVRSGGIAFPHIMVPDLLQMRGVAQPNASSKATAGSASVLRTSLDGQSEQGSPGVVLQNKEEDEPSSALSTMIAHALWLWNAKQNIADLVNQAQTRSLLFAESWLPEPLAHAVFGQVPGTMSAAEADAIEAREAEGQKNMLAKTDGPISCVAWHPHRSLLAIAHRATDCVFIYDLVDDTWCSNVLQNAYMQGITSMAWQPNCGYTLAVGCTTGVCMWNIMPAAGASDSADVLKAPGLGAGQFSAWMSLLSFPALPSAYKYPAQLPAGDNVSFHRSAASVSALSFSNSGQWLIVGHQTHGHLTVWDVALGTATPLKRSGSTSRSATLQVGISPNDRYLVSAHANGQLRLWETENWTSRVWSDFNANVMQFAWSPDSRSIYFAIADSADIYALALYKEAPSLDAEVTLVTTFEAHAAATAEDGEDSERVRVGGSIKSLALDPRGQRLVASFDDNSTSGDISLLAVYLVNNDALFRAGGDSSALMPLGYVRGPNWGKQHQLEKDLAAPESALKTDKTTKKKRVRVGTPTPSWFGFSPNFEPGALLTVAWANGKISLLPLLYTTKLSRAQ